MNREYILSADIGGSHITAAIVDRADGTVLAGSVVRKKIDNNAESDIILNHWSDALRSALSVIPAANLAGIGIAMPGPFNYTEGICLMKGVNKYDSLYGLNVSYHIRKQLNLPGDFPLVFENDASCFGLGESLSAEALPFNNVIAITLGTGFGATFLQDRKIRKSGNGVPPSGHLYNIPYRGGIAEDHISGAWILKTYNELSGNALKEVLSVAERAIIHKDEKALQVFAEFGRHLAACLLPWIKCFKAECLVIGGSISKSSRLFIPALQEALAKEKISLPLKVSVDMELSAITGAASLLIGKKDTSADM